MLDRHTLRLYNDCMELRELKYFLAVAEAESISGAAKSLYITQPSLSRQMQSLERQTGKQLFIRGSKKITLTEAGQLLKKRAEELIALYDKTVGEITSPTGGISGEIHIGCGESRALGIVAKAAKSLVETAPRIRFHFFSADTADVSERLEKGLIDFGVLVLPADVSKFSSIELPDRDVWGVLMRRDSPLASKREITPQDLYDAPLIRSRHTLSNSLIDDWFGKDAPALNIVATYNLLYNASLLVRQGVGYAIGLDKIINTSGDDELTFRPLRPKLETSLVFAWKKSQVFSAAAQKFLLVLKSTVAEANAEGQTPPQF